MMYVSSSFVNVNVNIKPMVYVGALASSISGLILGLETGCSGGTFVMEGFRKHLAWPPLSSGKGEDQETAGQQGWITGSFAFGAICGSLVSGILTDSFGRKTSIIGLSVVCTLGALVQLAAQDLPMLCCGRLVAGLAVGAMSMAATLYQSEVSPPCIRGLLVSMQQLAVAFGMLLAASLNVLLQRWDNGWRISYGDKAVFSLVLLVAMSFMPESPRWLFSKKRIEEARQALRVIRHEHEVEGELELLDLSSSEAKASWRELFSSRNLNLHRTLIAVTLQSFQQLSGINAVVYFAPQLFRMFLSPSQAILANLAIMAVGFFSTLGSLFAVDRAGRRALLMAGGIAMGLSALAFAFVLKFVGASFILVVLVAAYMVSFSFSWGPLSWVVAAEVFPQNLRGEGMTLSTLANWLSNFLVAKTVPYLFLPQVLDVWGTFTLFGCACAIMSLVVGCFLPETNGVALEQIQDRFSDFYHHQV